MKTKILLALALVVQAALCLAAGAEPPKSSDAPVVGKEPFPETMTHMKAEKPAVMKKQRDLLQQRYDLRNDPAPGVTMSGGKPIRHQAPYYTDNLMHNLQAGRCFKPRLIHGAMAAAVGPIKTFPPLGIKDSPPYLHDGRLLTLEDTVEFFNLILETKLTAPEKTDLVAFPRVL